MGLLHEDAFEGDLAGVSHHGRELGGQTVAGLFDPLCVTKGPEPRVREAWVLQGLRQIPDDLNRIRETLSRL